MTIYRFIGALCLGWAAGFATENPFIAGLVTFGVLMALHKSGADR